MKRIVIDFIQTEHADLAKCSYFVVPHTAYPLNSFKGTRVWITKLYNLHNLKGREYQQLSVQ
jgi:hypothetical protein